MRSRAVQHGHPGVKTPRDGQEYAMSDLPGHTRRRFLELAARRLLASEMMLLGAESKQTLQPTPRGVWRSPIRQTRAGVLDVGYHEAGTADGTPVLLLHGYPYSIDSYTDVASILADRGCRVIVPHLRGHGTTRFLDAATARSGQQAAIGKDVLDLLDALHVDRAVLAGFDWGGRAACVAAALWPERCMGLVSVNGYLIQNIATAALPIAPTVEAGLWYQFYFLTERGRAGLTENRRQIARILWSRNSPSWTFDEATFERSAAEFDNPDYVEVVLHSYRHRLGFAPGHPSLAALERRLAMRPAITVPTVTVDGDADGVVPATDGRAAASYFTGPRAHRVLEGVGHNPPQEDPIAFADAVWSLVSRQR